MRGDGRRTLPHCVSISHRTRMKRSVPTRDLNGVAVRKMEFLDMARRPSDPRDAAEAAFKSATTKPVEGPATKSPILPVGKELVSLRIDRDVLEFFQEEGPGWQDRINAALRRAAGK